MSWAGRSIRCAVIKPSDATGNWCAAPSPFAGITSVIPFPLRRELYPSSRSRRSAPIQASLPRAGTWGEKIRTGTSRRPQVSRPRALRAVRAWLEPWIMLRRYWRAWSEQPPPGPLQGLLDSLAHGQPLFLYCTCLRRTLLLVAPPAKVVDRSAHRGAADLHAMLRFPPLAILTLARLGVSFQQGWHAHQQGSCFPGWTPRNGPGQHVSRLAPLLQVALDGGP